MDPNNPGGANTAAGGASKSFLWKLPEGINSAWEFGKEANWPLLEKFLESSGDDDFHVNDEASERRLGEVQRLFNASRSSADWGALHAYVGNTGGDDVRLLKRLLALGIEPDLEGPKGCRPSHLCGYWARVECAKVIAVCRPCLTAKHDQCRTPRHSAATTTYSNDTSLRTELQEAQLKLRRPEVLKLWEELEKSGFPSVAEMASRRQWWAVKNLSRRRLVPRGELLDKYDGRTVVEWALVYGEVRMADELRFLFRVPLPAEDRVDLNGLRAKVTDMEKSFSQLREDVEKVSDSTAYAVAEVGAEAAKQQGVVTEYMSQLRIEVTDLGERVKEKEKKVTAKLEELEAEIQKIGGRRPLAPDSKKSEEQVRRAGKRMPQGAGTASAAEADRHSVNGIASYLLKKAESVACSSEQSPLFLARLAELLEEFDEPQH